MRESRKPIAGTELIETGSSLQLANQQVVKLLVAFVFGLDSLATESL